jgi:L-iditol 2-dehydrogenase
MNTSKRPVATTMPARFPAAIVRAWGKLEVTEIPALPLGPYDAVCKIEVCSTCAATDSHLIEGTFPRTWCAEPPFVIGHESAGRVVAAGEKVRYFESGQRVVRPMWKPAEGQRPGGFGSSWGGFATWGIIRDVRAWAEDTSQPMPEHPWKASATLPEMPARDATLFVTWRDCMGCLLDIGVRAGQRVVVFGSGGNGLAFTRFATLLGAQVVLVGSPTRFAKATKLGAKACVDYRAKDVAAAVREALGGAGAEVAIEAVGAAGHLPQMIASLAEGGTLFLFGIAGDGQLPVNIFAGPGRYTIMRKNRDTEPVGHDAVLRYYQSGEIRPEDFCDGELPLARIAEAFEAIRRKEAIKIAITLPG